MAYVLPLAVAILLPFFFGLWIANRGGMFRLASKLHEYGFASVVSKGKVSNRQS